MVTKVNGFASAFESVSRNLQYYTVYASSPGAHSAPEIATGINIRITKDIKDDSQKNFEVLIQAIGLRAMPIIMNEPVAVSNLQNYGSPSLSGEGFVWKFAVELEGVFENFGTTGTIGPVGLLVDELNGIVLPSGVLIKTKGGTINMEFTRTELLS